MAAYLVAQIRDVKDPAGFEEYRRKAGATLEAYGGKLRAVGEIRVLEGDWHPGLAIFEFESVERATAWYESDEYRPLIELRQRAADVQLVIVPGV